MEGNSKEFCESREIVEKLDRLAKLSIIRSQIDKGYWCILSMLCDCHKKQFPFLELEHDLDSAFMAMNSLMVKISNLEEYFNEKVDD